MASLILRGPTFYIQFMQSGTARRVSTGTESIQIAKEKLRQFESAQARGDASPFPTRTAIADVLTAFVTHLRATCTPKSAQTNIYYLRDAFGPICDALRITSRKVSDKVKKRPPKPGQDRRKKAAVITAARFEQITTGDIAGFITSQMASRGLSPKTANSYREILTRLFNWAMTQGGVRMPSDKNPAAAVKRYREHAPTITYLKWPQIREQLAALEGNVKMQAAVATFIFAGLRREELVWLTQDDLDLTSGKFGVIRVQAKMMGDDWWEPKTKTNRGVPVSSHLRPYLDKLLKEKLPGPYVFPNSEGNRFDPDNFSRDLRTLNEAKGLAWTNLVYRHTFGTQLAASNASLYRIATLMGNSPEICRRHYAAMMPESLLESVEFAEPNLYRPSPGVIAPVAG